jgi:hypothetical protein
VISQHTALFAWLVPVILAAPWIVGSIAYWHARPRDGFLPPSHADLSLRR